MEKKRYLALLAIPLIVLLGLAIITRNIPTSGKAIHTQLSATSEEPSAQAGTVTGATIYIYGSSLVASSTQTGITYHYQDHLSTNSFTTNKAGVLQSRVQTYPYGKALERQSTSGGVQKYTFTGKEDDGKLMYFVARYMDPRTGRFISVDPIIRTYSNYNYADNNPLSYNDPEGKGLNDIKELCKGACYGVGQSIVRLPEALQTFAQDPVGTISQMPSQFAQSARASYPAGSFGGFGTSTDPFEAGQHMTSVALTLLGLGYSAGGGMPRINFNMPQLAVATTGEAAIPVLIGGSIEITGGIGGIVGPTILAMAKKPKSNQQQTQSKQSSTPTGPSREDVLRPFAGTDFRKLLYKSSGQQDIFDRLAGKGIYVDKTTGKYPQLTDVNGNPLRNPDGRPVTISSTPHDEWTTVANHIGQQLNRVMTDINSPTAP